MQERFRAVQLRDWKIWKVVSKPWYDCFILVTCQVEKSKVSCKLQLAESFIPSCPIAALAALAASCWKCRPSTTHLPMGFPMDFSWVSDFRRQGELADVKAQELRMARAAEEVKLPWHELLLVWVWSQLGNGKTVRLSH